MPNSSSNQDSGAENWHSKVATLETMAEHTQRQISDLASRTESQISSLAINLSRQMEQFMTATSESQRQLSHTVDGLAKRQAEYSRFPVANVISFAALLITVISVVGVGFVINPLEENKRSDEQIMQRFYDHVKDGHPNVVKERVLFNAENITQLESRYEAWVQARLPVEAEHSTKLEAMRKQMDAMAAQMRELLSGEAKDQERLHSIEREMFKGTNYNAGRPVP